MANEDQHDLNKKLLDMKVNRFNERLATIEKETGMTQIAVLDWNPYMGIRPALVVMPLNVLKRGENVPPPTEEPKEPEPPTP